MSKIAILSDIHSNLPALKAVLAEVQERGAAQGVAGIGSGCAAGAGVLSRWAISEGAMHGLLLIVGDHFHHRKIMKLSILPCLDDDGMAACRWCELQIPRDVAAKLGRAAVEAAVAGRYIGPSAGELAWRDAVEAACSSKGSIPPEMPLPDGEGTIFAETRVQVTNETTLGAGCRLVQHGLHPLALNFANGVHPGGGFLTGSLAQEEAICRSCALFHTLVDDPIYQAHSLRTQPDSTQWAILSPDVPVFRNEDGTVPDRPWSLSFPATADGRGSLSIDRRRVMTTRRHKLLEPRPST